MARRIAELIEKRDTMDSGRRKTKVFSNLYDSSWDSSSLRWPTWAPSYWVVCHHLCSCVIIAVAISDGMGEGLS